jgi:hypothetical protein
MTLSCTHHVAAPAGVATARSPPVLEPRYLAAAAPPPAAREEPPRALPLHQLARDPEPLAEDLPKRLERQEQEPKARPPSAIALGVLAGALDPLRADDPTLPDAIMAAARGKTLEGSYWLCISTSGRVKSVTPVVSIAGADQNVVSTLKTWKFPELPTELCKIQTLSFEVP